MYQDPLLYLYHAQEMNLHIHEVFLQQIFIQCLHSLSVWNFKGKGGTVQGIKAVVLFLLFAHFVYHCHPFITCNYSSERLKETNNL